MTQQDLFQTVISSQPDIHANPSVSPGSKEARKMTAISGRKYLPLFKQNDPIGLFARMFLDTLTWASTKCYLTWRIKPVTQSKHFVLELWPSMPPTADNEFSLLHTPTATANQMAPSINSGWWATPDASPRGSRAADLVKNGSTVERRGSGQMRGIDLQTQVKMWPTPTAVVKEEDYEVWLARMQRKTDPKSNRKTKPSDLGIAVKMWPTPTTRDHKGGYQGGRVRNGKVSMDTLDVPVQHIDNQQKTGGQLNPQWVEWLMGYPEGWTDLKD